MLAKVNALSFRDGYTMAVQVFMSDCSLEYGLIEAQA